MVQIKPLQIPTKGTGTQLYVQANSFPANAKTTMLYWYIANEDGVNLLDGNLQMTEEQFAAWGEDNNYLNEIVADALNLEIVEN